jgi:hypothetical protein
MAIDAVTRRVSDMEKELETLLVEAESLVAPEEREEFATQVELMFLEANGKLIEMCSKIASSRSADQSEEINQKWRDLRAKSEALRRRNELFSDSTTEEFKATLMWMAEQGTADDLPLLRRVRTTFRDCSADVNHLFEIAEQRISRRVTGFSE